MLCLHPHHVFIIGLFLSHDLLTHAIIINILLQLYKNRISLANVKIVEGLKVLILLTIVHIESNLTFISRNTL